MTAAQEQSRRKRLCSAARAIFIGEVGFTVGAVRLRWDPAKVVAHDYRLAAVEARFRERLIRECVEIMTRYDGGVQPSTDRVSTGQQDDG